MGAFAGGSAGHFSSPDSYTHQTPPPTNAAQLDKRARVHGGTAAGAPCRKHKGVARARERRRPAAVRLALPTASTKHRAWPAIRRRARGARGGGVGQPANNQRTTNELRTRPKREAATWSMGGRVDVGFVVCGGGTVHFGRRRGPFALSPFRHVAWSGADDGADDGADGGADDARRARPVRVASYASS